MAFKKRLIALSAMIIAIAACNEGGTEVESNINFGTLDVNTYALNKLVCDPFGGGDDPSPQGGIKSEIFYLEHGSGNSVSHIINNGTKLDQHIFFSQLYVPTRRFNLGFPTGTGESIKTASGDALVENFALQNQTVIKLGPEDEPGLYEFALLSDDGSILEIRDGGSYVEIVNNDGDHETRFGCGNRAVYMGRDDSYLAKISYYQGPREHIALIPMWRRISNENEVGSDSSCGKYGNSMYFDYNNNSQPKAAYNNLLARGWKPLSASNYELPNSVATNPCQNGQAPIITNIFVRDLLDSQILVSWVTDIPATAQVRIVDLDSGQEVLTYSDNTLRLEHEVVVQNLKRNVNYMVQAVSISATYGKSLSYGYNLRIEE